jgi:hypothetical protein
VAFLKSKLFSVPPDSRLERCLLPKEEFHHSDHLIVAVVYLYAGDFDAAMRPFTRLGAPSAVLTVT